VLKYILLKKGTGTLNRKLQAAPPAACVINKQLIALVKLNFASVSYTTKLKSFVFALTKNDLD
jgi:hypothetical protein